MKKTIIIPCYNEKKTINQIIELVRQNISENDNIIIVDDASTDGTRDLLKKIDNKQISIIFHEKNYGKGRAIKTALDGNLNDIIIIQDADLEYDPKEYQKLLLPFQETNADVVYGSRFLGGSKYSRIHYFWHYIANKLLTYFTNFFTNLNMSDMETGYKVFKKKVIKSIDLKERSFGIEVELTIKLAKKKFIFYEVPISYAGRSYSEGKKIGLRDAFRAIYCIVFYYFSKS
jgi:glycosyltransferase involved in cell wall biosynthesis